MTPVALNDANEQIQEQLLLMWRQRCQNFGIGDTRLGAQASPKRRALWRDVEFAGTPVGTALCAASANYFANQTPNLDFSGAEWPWACCYRCSCCLLDWALSGMLCAGRVCVQR